MLRLCATSMFVNAFVDSNNHNTSTLTLVVVGINFTMKAIFYDRGRARKLCCTYIILTTIEHKTCVMLKTSVMLTDKYV